MKGIEAYEREQERKQLAILEAIYAKYGVTTADKVLISRIERKYG